MRAQAQTIMDIGFIAAVLAAVTALLAGAAPAAQPSTMAQAGQRLVAEHCSTCHAIGARGESPNPAAPALRTLAERYSEEGLEEAFEAGLIASHPAMPSFNFSRDQLRAILIYLQSIQELRQA